MPKNGKLVGSKRSNSKRWARRSGAVITRMVGDEKVEPPPPPVARRRKKMT